MDGTWDQIDRLATHYRPARLPSAQTLRVDLASIPDELKRIDRWVVWRWISKGKPPVNARTGRLADSTDPETWVPFVEAAAVYETGEYDGIGFVLAKTADEPSGLVGIDLDHCRDAGTGIVNDWAKRIIGQLDTYTEISPSGTGIRMFIHGRLPAHGRKKADYENYEWGRYVTITGQRIDGTQDAIQDRQTALQSVHREIFGAPKKAMPSVSAATTKHSDIDLIRKGMEMRGGAGDKFKRLWSGETDDFPSASEADLGLCNYLAFLCGQDEGRIDRLFRQSGLLRDKWEREDYRLGTIRKALEGRTEFLGSRTPATNGKHSDAGDQVRPGPVIYKMTDLMGMIIPPANWAVPGIMGEGMSILAGKPKLGKSWMALNLALTIAGGGTALGMTKVEPGNVLYLSLEDRLRRVQDRTRKLLKGLDVEISERLEVAIEWPKQGSGGFDLLAEWFNRTHKPKLVIIDVWQKFRPPLKSGSQYEQDYEAATQIKSLADHYGASVLPLHHTRKAVAEDVVDEISGTLGLAGAADGLLVLSRIRSETEGKLKITGRDVDDQELALEFDKETFCWKCVGDAKSRDESRTKNKIMTVFKQASGSGYFPKEMADLINENENTVRNAMWRLVNDGILRKQNAKYFWPIEEAAPPPF